jgi:hypothetical protein
VLLLADGRHDEARACYRRAVAAFEATHGPTHPQLVVCRENFAALASQAA